MASCAAALFYYLVHDLFIHRMTSSEIRFHGLFIRRIAGSEKLDFRPGLLLVASVSEHYLLLHRQTAVGLLLFTDQIRKHLLINLVSRPELNGERKVASSVDFSTPTVIISHSLDIFFARKKLLQTPTFSLYC